VVVPFRVISTNRIMPEPHQHGAALLALLVMSFPLS
jgi:hypothetical protein